MNKPKILTVRIIGCIFWGLLIGLGWWLCDGGKREPDIKVESVLKSKEIKIYQGKWIIKDRYLEVIK